MASSNPQSQPGQPSLPRAQPLLQAQPLPPGQVPPPAPQFPQGYPQGQPYPQPPQYPPNQPTAPASGYPPTTPPAVSRSMPLPEPPSSSRPPERQEEEGEENELTDYALQRSPPWLISAVIHMVGFIVLALWMVVQESPKNRISLDAEMYAEQIGEQLEFDTPLAGTDPEKLDEPVFTLDDLALSDNPFAAPSKMDIIPDGITATSDIKANIGLALLGRDEGSKRALLGAYGGTELTERAVHLGLEWLAKVQKRNGSWSLKGPYSSGAADDNLAAATAMALLAFQGAGNTHQKGEFSKNVALGWKWLLEEQDRDGCFFHEGAFHHRFYTQGQCTIALCEVYGMSRDENLRKPAELAVQYLLRSQSPEGGWRYTPQSDSDVSVTGWIVMALQSARMAGLEVPQDTFRRIGRFLDKVALNGGSRYPYQDGQEATLTMTAEALLCRQYLGWPRSDARLVEGVEWITRPENLVNFKKGRNVYYWYYATQVCHHMEGDYWKRWNGVMRQALPEQQIKSGREAGSWDPLRPTRDEWEAHGGRLYVTCLSIYMLEVYYRHMPLYSNVFSLLPSLTSPQAGSATDEN